MKGQQNGGSGWVVGAAVIIGVILVAKLWGPPTTYPTGDDTATKIIRQQEENRLKAPANR